MRCRFLKKRLAIDDDGMVTPGWISCFVNVVAFVLYSQFVPPRSFDFIGAMSVQNQDVLSMSVDGLELESPRRWHIDEIEAGGYGDDIDEFAIPKAFLIELP
jgi:hypothetical protein